MRFYLGEQRFGSLSRGGCVVPWWSIGWLIDQRHQSIQIGPVEVIRYRMGPSDYSVSKGTITAGWHWWFRWRGLKNHKTEWMVD